MIISKWPEKALQALRSRPPGAVMSSVEIAQAAGLTQHSMVPRLDQMARHGIVARHSKATRPMLWTLGPADDPAAALANLRAEGGRKSDTRAISMQRAKQTAQSAMVGQLRDLMLVGTSSVSGDPLRELVEAMDAARAVMAARYQPGCRFSGAEVDVMVARELRQISEAARRATVNLRASLWILLT